MIIASVRAQSSFVDGRLDAKYHCSPGVLANERTLLLKINGADLRWVAGEGGLGRVDPPSRTKRVYAAPGEESAPYLRPYDVFDYLPQAADLLPKTGSSDLGRLMPEPGTILQTCSGRNLGPLAYTDAYISRFVVSDDMLRLHIDDESDRLYTLAFLSTPTGQALLTRSKTGNVIDHLSADNLGSIEVPFIDDALTDSTVVKMREAVETRESARLRLDALIRGYERSLPQPSRREPLRDGWTQRAASLGSRVDSAYHDPLVQAVRSDLHAGGGVRVSDAAETFIPGRYKRYYVETEHGRPIVSGRQLLQTKPVNLRYIAARSFDFSVYSMEEGMVAFGAEGRAEERISLPALITPDRSDWLANNHVMRVRPKAGINPGWLYLSFAAWQVQAQVKACSCGSVVDTVYPIDLDNVLLPAPDEQQGEAAFNCWQDFARANEVEREAVQTLESAILCGADALI
jgi:hypothetical protein